jgi:glycosyltransferase involved in cell wall biosynthesis
MMSSSENEQANAPLVTVVVSAYNSADYVNRAVRSVCVQTFTDYELLVIDDCSEACVVGQYELPCSARLICLDRNHGHASAGRNLGIREARGKYVAFLDMDDVWLPTKLATQVAMLEADPAAGLTFGPVLLADEAVGVIGRQSLPVLNVTKPLRRMVYENFIQTPSCVLARRDVLIECGLFDEQLYGCEDWDMWLRIAMRYPFCIDPTPLVIYTVHSGNPARRTERMVGSKSQVYRKLLTWAESERRDLRPLIRRRTASALRGLARFQMSEGGSPLRAVQTLRMAASAWPLTITNYTLAMKALFLMSGRFRR